MTKRVKRKKSLIEVKMEVLQKLKMSVEQVEVKLREIMPKHKIGITCFRALVVEDDSLLIITSVGTIECDIKMRKSKMRESNVGFTVGNNATGHRLPASSTGLR